MKRITKEELPIVLTDDVVEILIEMGLEFPQTKEWHEVFDLLDERGQLMMILNKVDERKKLIERVREDAKSEKQKQKEKEDWNEFVKNADPTKFYGNMGEPTGVYDYKGKYGVWPPGIDDSIAPLNISTRLDKEQIVKIANLYLRYRKTIQWGEVSAALKKHDVDFSIIFNSVVKLNYGVFPTELSAHEFKDKYDVWPPGL